VSPHAAAGPRRRTRHGGFTLVEVLVALAIVALALGAGMKAAGALTDNAQRLGDVTAAQWCAENQLTTLRLSKSFPGTGDSDFACEQLGRSYRGKLSALVVPLNPNFSQVHAQVYDERGVQLLRLSTVIGRY
jgi:general secretion pathway protein I